ncbi:MAG TPA: hypothetical protein VND66_05185 [Acidobacteriaceae bacterium]|nr:hypothetical protein [Acidobacteriaceae bacterium]
MVFERILWMFVYLRLLGSELAIPAAGMTLFAYAAQSKRPTVLHWRKAKSASRNVARFRRSKPQ